MSSYQSMSRTLQLRASYFEITEIEVIAAAARSRSVRASCTSSFLYSTPQVAGLLLWHPDLDQHYRAGAVSAFLEQM